VSRTRALAIVRWRTLLDRVLVCEDGLSRLAVARSIAAAKQPVVVAFVNAHAANLVWDDQEFAADLLRADILLRDGVGMRLWMKLAGREPGLNMNGTDFIPLLLEQMPRSEGVVIMGTKEPWLSGGRHWLETRGIDVVATEHGFHPEEYYVAKARSLQAGVIVLAMGMPKQERVAQLIKEAVAERDMVIVNGGAVVDFWAQKFPRAPVWMRRVGLEWLYRLILEPNRLWRRYLVGNIVFLLRAIRVQLTKSV